MVLSAGTCCAKWKRKKSLTNGGLECASPERRRGASTQSRHEPADCTRLGAPAEADDRRDRPRHCKNGCEIEGAAGFCVVARVALPHIAHDSAELDRALDAAVCNARALGIEDAIMSDSLSGPDFRTIHQRLQRSSGRHRSERRRSPRVVLLGSAGPRRCRRHGRRSVSSRPRQYAGSTWSSPQSRSSS
jgi:hypothetical protein